jgi:hypothetical protein
MGHIGTPILERTLKHQAGYLDLMEHPTHYHRDGNYEQFAGRGHENPDEGKGEHEDELVKESSSAVLIRHWKRSVLNALDCTLMIYAPAQRCLHF